MKEILFKPFEKYSENKLIISGVLITIIGSFIGLVFNARFDGVLDVHFVKQISLIEMLRDCLINISILTLLLFISAKIINVKTRFIDVLVVTLISRAPLYLISFLNVNNMLSSISVKVQESAIEKNLNAISLSEMTFLIITAILTLLFVVWHAVLLFNGFKIASNSKKSSGVVLFISSLIIAEIISKYLIYML